VSLTGDTYLPLVAEQVEKEIGLVIEPWQYGFLQKNINKRLSALGLGSILQYWRLLKADSFKNPEFQSLVNMVTNNETFFFRIPQQYGLIQQHLFPIIRRTKTSKQLKIWSAGCSSGEEIYTLAMLLKDEAEKWDGWKCSLLATDISQSILEMARKGIYSARSVQYIPPHFKERFIQPREAGMFQVSSEIRNMVHFEYHNLADSEPGPATDLLKDIDIIFFRNVMIYFKLDTIRRVISSFSDMAHRNGFLILGPAETLWKVSRAFVPMLIADQSVYRRPDADPVQGAREQDPSQDEPVLEEEPMIIVEKKKPQVVREKPRLKFNLEEFLKTHREKARVDSAIPEPDLAQAITKPSPKSGSHEGAKDQSLHGVLPSIKSLMDRGDWEDASSLAQEAISRFPDAPDLNFLLTLIFDQQGNFDSALQYCRRVLYLKGDVLFPRLLYARLLKREGKHKESLFQYREIMKRFLRGKVGHLEYHEDFIPLDDQRVFFEAKRMLEKG